MTTKRGDGASKRGGTWRAHQAKLGRWYATLQHEGALLGIPEEDVKGICTIAAQAIYDAWGRYPWPYLGVAYGRIDVGTWQRDLVREAFVWYLRDEPSEHGRCINAVYQATGAVFKEQRDRVKLRSRGSTKREYYLDPSDVPHTPIEEDWRAHAPIYEHETAFDRIEQNLSDQQDVARYRALIGERLWLYLSTYARTGSLRDAGAELGCSDQTVLNRVREARRIVAEYLDTTGDWQVPTHVTTVQRKR